MFLFNLFASFLEYRLRDSNMFINSSGDNQNWVYDFP